MRPDGDGAGLGRIAMRPNGNCRVRIAPRPGGQWSGLHHDVSNLVSLCYHTSGNLKYTHSKRVLGIAYATK